MTLQTSGPISINDIKSEFNSTANDLLSYYRGGGIVANQAPNLGIPTSGPISLEDFYGAQNVGGPDVTPSNTWFNNVSGQDETNTNIVTIAGITGPIDLYYTLSGQAPFISYRINGGSWVGWPTGSPGNNTVTVSNGQQFQLQFVNFQDASGSISIFNDSDQDKFLDGISYTLTVGGK